LIFINKTIKLSKYDIKKKKKLKNKTKQKRVLAKREASRVLHHLVIEDFLFEDVKKSPD
jgi:hypothetical protein